MTRANTTTNGRVAHCHTYTVGGVCTGWVIAPGCGSHYHNRNPDGTTLQAASLAASVGRPRHDPADPGRRMPGHPARCVEP